MKKKNKKNETDTSHSSNLQLMQPNTSLLWQTYFQLIWRIIIKMGHGGWAVKASDSWPLAMGSIPYQFRSLWYASGHCMHNLLSLPTKECTRTIWYLIIECVCHKTVIVCAKCRIGCLPDNHVYIYIQVPR